jgi:unsaturated chondroitin disaccharide hydrolase
MFAALSSGVASALRGAVAFAGDQLERTVRLWPPERPSPVHTVRGKWYRPDDLWTDWTPGFLAGQLWILAKLTGDARWRERAEAFTRKLGPRRFDRDVHDLGFIFLSSYARWADALAPGDPLRAQIEDVVVTAANVQSFRWNGNGPHGFIYSFNGPQSLFIDVMMNVRLLFWAAQRGAGPEVGRRAVEHCRTSARYLVRRPGRGLGDVDGSVAHEAIFNTEPRRGEFRCLSTQQGYSPFTCWARGLAWALYGFADAYRYTRDPEMLAVSERCAAFYLANTRPDGVPFWDYGAPAIPSEPLDSSAAAIAGCGFDLLAGLASPDRAGAYRKASIDIATTLSGESFLARGQEGEEGIILHAVYHRPRGWGVDASVQWGDYFFLELAERLLEPRAPTTTERVLVS